MNILVTGGAGFIGSNFVHYTIKNYPQNKIYILDALTYAANLKSLEPVKDQIEIIADSINNMEILQRLAPKIDLIVNFAAESHNDNSITHPENFINTNIIGTYNLLEIARDYHIQLHHISTDEVFGDLELNSNQSFTESSPYNPSSPYSASKAASDLLVRAWVRTFGVKATISNCSNNYGPYQHIEKFIPHQITNLINGKPIELYGDGRHVRDWIHVEDHISGIWQIIEQGSLGQTYLIGANGILSNLQVAQMLLEIFGLPNSQIKFIADRPGHDRKYAINPAKLTNELGWKPAKTDFYQGLEETVNWYQQNTGWWDTNPS